MSARFTVEFLGRTTRAVRSLSFGRAAELVLEAENPYLHGEAGRFVLTDGRWLLHNTGSTLRLRLLHQTGFRAELPPGTSTSMPGGHGRIQLRAGPTTYEFDYFLIAEDEPPEITRRRSGTLFYGRDLTPAQHDYAVTLAAPRLRGSSAPLPTQAEIAGVWSVATGTVGRTFEEIRRRLRDEGVRAIQSPEELVAYLIDNGIVTPEHVAQAALDQPHGPIRREQLEARQRDAGEIIDG